MSEVDDYVDAFVGQRNDAIARARSGMSNADRDPDSAGRAMRLSQIYGVPAEAIYPEVEGFEGQAEEQISGDLIKNSSPLANYALSHPMAPHVSADDWDNLYRASQKVDLLNEHSDHSLVPYKALHAMGYGFRHFTGSVAEGAGIISPEQQKDWDESTFTGMSADQREEMKEYLSSWTGSIMSGVGGMAPLVAAPLAATFLGIPGSVASVGAIGAMALAGGSESAEMAREHGATPTQETEARIGGLITGGLMGAIPLKMIEEPVKALMPGLAGWTAAKAVQASKFGLGFTALGEVQHAVDTLIARGTYDPNASYGDAEQLAQRAVTGFVLGGLMGAGFGKVKSYVDAGKPVPHGIDPDADKLIEANSAEAVKKLDEALSEIQATNTHQRSPELIAKFLEPFPNTEMRVSADAINALYGDKIPEAGDGLLGDISPDLDAQLDLASRNGGKVAIPIKDWLTKVDPEVAKVLHDDIQVVHGGLTLNEIKAAREARAAAEEPAFTPAEVRKMSIAMPDEPGADMARGIDSAQEAGGIKRQQFRLEDIAHEDEETGELVHPIIVDDKPIGNIHLNVADDGWLEITDMYTHGGSAWSIGYTGAKELLQQLQIAYPDAQGVVGLKGRQVKGVKFEDPTPEEIRNFMEDISNTIVGGTWVRMGDIKGYMVPEDLWTRNEQEMAARFEREVQRIAPRKLNETILTHGLVIPSEKMIPSALFTYNKEGYARILVALSTGMDEVGLAWHEALHHLRTLNFFDPAEWDVLTRAAREEGWMDQYRIRERYGEQPHDVLLEEAIAHRFADFQREFFAEKLTRQAILEQGGWRALMLRLADLIQGIRTQVSEVFGRVPDWKELFHMTAESKIGNRDIEASRQQVKEAATRAAVDVPEIDEQTFANPKYMGMTKRQIAKLIKLQNKLNQENADAVIGHARDLEKRDSKADWKADREEVEKEVTRDIQNRPDVAVDRFFGKGEIGGVKLKGRPKFQEDSLTPEQRALLPPEYIAKQGFAPDEIAGMFGYQSGDMMITNLSSLVQQRLKANMEPAPFLRRLIDQRTEQVMKERYGTLEERINDRATDRVLSNLQLQVLNEEILGAAEAAGQQLPVDLKVVASELKTKFDDQPVRLVKSDGYFQDALKAANEAAVVSKAGKETTPAGAIDALQRQGHSLVLAKEAKAVEKLKLKFERFRNQFDKGIVTSVNQEHTNWIRWLLKASGAPIKDSMEAIQREVSEGQQTSLKDFIDHRNIVGHSDVWMPYYMIDGEAPIPLDRMSVGQFKSFWHSLQTIKADGVAEQKEVRAGEEFAKEVRLTKIIDKVEQTGKAKEIEIDRPPSNLKRFVNMVREFGAAGITVETYFNRVDRGDPHGDLSKIARGVASAVNSRDADIRSYNKKWIDITSHWTNKYMDKLVDNPLFKNPTTGEPIRMRMRNLISVAMNMSANKAKFLKGYGLEEKEVMEWLDNYMQEKDWRTIQRIYDEIWSPLFDRADTMTRNLTGVGIDRIENIPPVVTKYGTFDGWYHPLKYDRRLLDPKAKAYAGDIEALFPEGQEGQGYYRASTPHSYAKARTGFVGPVQLNMDVVPLRIREMIHDINVRPALKDAAEVFYDKEFRQAYRTYMGKFADAQLEPWLHAVANSVRTDYQMMHAANGWIEFARQNLINTLIGFNPYTVMKHGPTAFVNSLTEAGIDKTKFLKYTTMMLNPVTRRQLFDIATTKSEEVARRWTKLGDIRAEIGQEGLFKNIGWRDYFSGLGSKMVSLSDMFSTVPAWHAAYDKAMETIPSRAEYKGMTTSQLENVAIGIADKAVRSAHGSTSIANKPAIMRGSPFWQTYTSLFNFFSHMQQKHYQLAWQARETYKGVKEWKDGNKSFADAMEFAPQLTWGLFSYVLWPAIVEEMVTPMTDDEHESWGHKAFKTMAIGTSSSYVGIRDLVRAMFTNRSYDPQVGMVGTYLKSYYDLGRDAKKAITTGDMTDEQAGELIKHAVTVFGNVTGYTTAQEGKWAEYAWRYMNGLEHPDATWADLMAMNAGKTAKKGKYKSPLTKGLELLGMEGED